MCIYGFCRFKNNNLPDGKIIWISVIVAAGCGLITLLLVMPYLRKKAILWDQEQQRYAQIDCLACCRC